MVLRIGGGDLNGIVGLLGFAIGILVGVFFLKKGYSLQRANTVSKTDSSFLLGMVILTL